MAERIRWEINSECNLNCIHCFAADNYRRHQMSLERQLHTIEIIHNEGIREVMISSREPLLSKSIITVIKNCKNKGIHVTVLTNGILLSSQDFAYDFVNSGVDSVAISIEGITSKSNDYIRGEGALNKVKNAVINLNNAAVELSKPISITIQMLLYPGNVEECKQLIEEVNEWKINTLTIGNIAPMGNAKEHPELILGYEKYKEACEQILYFYTALSQKNYHLRFKSLSVWDELILGYKYNYRLPAVLSSCSALNNVFSLMSDGKVIPCIMLENKISSDMFITTSEINSRGYYLSANVARILENMKCEQCRGCYFENECKPCPGSDTNSVEFLMARKQCAESRKEFDNFFETAIKNSHKFHICFTNTLINITENTVTFNSYYDDGNVKEYSIDKNEDLLEFLDKMKSEKTLQEVLYDCKNKNDSMRRIIYDLLAHGLLELVGDKYECFR